MKFDIFSAFEGFLAGQRDNLLVWISVFLGAGSAFYFGLLYEPSVPMICGLLSGIIVLFVILFRLYHRESDSALILVSFICGACLLCANIGFAAAKFKTNSLNTVMINHETRPVMVTGIVDHREEQEGRKGSLFFLSDVKIKGWDLSETPQKIRVTVKQKNNAAAGDRIEVLAKLTPLSGPVAPHTYDFARHYYFEGIGALGYALSKVSVIDHAETGLINLETIRTSISNHIKTVVPEREAGIAAALMTGERAAISDEDWDALRASGLAHIISISGLHVAMVAAPVFFLVRLFLAMIPVIALRFPIKKIAAGVALLVCCLYVGLVVPSVPTTRSLLMTGVALIAIMLDRSPFSLRLVGASAILLLLVSPESIWSVSFQMSFAAVAALVSMAEVIRPYMSRLYTDAGLIKKIMLFIAGTLLTSLVASLATAPYSLYHFQQVPSYSVLANALSVPISGLMIMPMVIISFALLPFGLADWSLKILGVGVDWLLDIARWTESLPGAVITTTAMPDLFLVMMTCAGLVLVLYQGIQRAWALVPFILAFFSIWWMAQPDIIVSNDGGVMAVKDQQHVFLSSMRKDKFATETWLKRWGKKSDDVLPFPRQGQVILERGGAISCDPSACRIETGGLKISFGSRLYELKQDCEWANKIITDIRLPKDFCKDGGIQQFGYYDFKENGAMSIFIKDRVVIDRVGHDRGFRPWVNDYR